MVPPLVIAPAMAAVILGVGTANWSVAAYAAAIAFVTVPLSWWPVIFWMVDNARVSTRARVIAGVVCGLAPFAAAVVSGIIGLYMKKNDLAYVGWVLERGAPVPVIGTFYWPRFGWLVLLGVAAGVATMLVLGILQRAPLVTRSKRYTE